MLGHHPKFVVGPQPATINDNEIRCKSKLPTVPELTRGATETPNIRNCPVQLPVSLRLSTQHLPAVSAMVYLSSLWQKRLWHMTRGSPEPLPPVMHTFFKPAESVLKPYSARILNSTTGSTRNCDQVMRRVGQIQLASAR
eukprot:gnl/TRDRNA2_/TRDRNA2_48798_c0_seq1.p2 gnl/TRDRNA2_/TRDRNA2_48798_c0~~gnl/TRDRNA2_/TRDRNA2_48798_c0_seq1.p2  ORF type:complete len:140 (-),score=12.72 gnl/TRDRNA2_/TRDRNA2_48798_c0_seq1:26-445(-)